MKNRVIQKEKNKNFEIETNGTVFSYKKENSFKNLKNYLFISLFLLIPFISLHAQTYEVFKGDTINYTGENDNKEGYWIVFKNKTDQVLQEGTYLYGKKEGVWRSYYVNGNIKSEITYIKGEKKGEAKIFYENGNIAEEGIWMSDKWVGKYKSYYQNGKLSYLWNYNDYGNRSGYQQYFYQNGNVKIEGEWKDGMEQGIIKEYFETGALRLEKNFLLGKCDLSTIKIYSEKDSITKRETDIIKDNIIVEKTDTSSIIIDKNDTLEIFSGNGMHIFYNKDKQPDKEGEFLNGILIKGKHYIYDDSGKLVKTSIYEDGKIVEIIQNKE